MLEGVPLGSISDNFQVHEDGRVITELRVSSWLAKAEFDIRGVRYELDREGFFLGDFVLKRDGNVLARAARRNALFERFDFRMFDHCYSLRGLSLWNRRFGLFEGEKQVGTIYPVRAFARHALIDLPADWPAAIRIFVFWLVLVIWNQETGAA